jgi:hypothetical protein
MFVRDSPLFRPLTLLVKQWAKSRGLVDSTKGKLNSFTFALMVAFFLQVNQLAPIIDCSAEAMHARRVANRTSSANRTDGGRSDTGARVGGDGGACASDSVGHVPSAELPLSAAAVAAGLEGFFRYVHVHTPLRVPWCKNRGD